MGNNAPDKPCAKCGAKERAKSQSYCYDCVTQYRKPKFKALLPPLSQRPCAKCGKGKRATNQPYCQPCISKARERKLPPPDKRPCPKCKVNFRHVGSTGIIFAYCSSCRSDYNSGAFEPALKVEAPPVERCEVVAKLLHSRWTA